MILVGSLLDELRARFAGNLFLFWLGTPTRAPSMELIVIFSRRLNIGHSPALLSLCLAISRTATPFSLFTS